MGRLPPDAAGRTENGAVARCRTCRRGLLFILAFSVPAIPPAAVAQEKDQGKFAVIEMKEGGSFSGYVTEEAEVYVVRKKGGTVRVPRASVTSIKYQDPPDVGGDANAGLGERVSQMEKRMEALEKILKDIQARLTAAPATPQAGAPPNASPPAAGGASRPDAAIEVPADPRPAPKPGSPEHAKMQHDFMEWSAGQVKFQKLNRTNTVKYLDGKLHRWAVVPKEVNLKASELGLIHLVDPGKRYILVDVTVLATTKSGGYLENAWVMDGENRRYEIAGQWWEVHQTPYFWDVDKYYVDPLCGATLRKWLRRYHAYWYYWGQFDRQLRQAQEIRGGLGFVVTHDAKELVLDIEATITSEQIVITAPATRSSPGSSPNPAPSVAGKSSNKETREVLRLKIGDMPKP